jgi:hypothetical protein
MPFAHTIGAVVREQFISMGIAYNALHRPKHSAPTLMRQID